MPAGLPGGEESVGGEDSVNLPYTEMMRRRRALRILQRVRQHVRNQKAYAQYVWLITAQDADYLAAERAEGILLVAVQAVYGFSFGPTVRGESVLALEAMFDRRKA